MRSCGKAVSEEKVQVLDAGRHVVQDRVVRKTLQLDDAVQWVRDIRVPHWPRGCVEMRVLLGWARTVTLTQDIHLEDVWDLGPGHDEKLGRGIPVSAMKYQNIQLEFLFHPELSETVDDIDTRYERDDDAEPMLAWDSDNDSPMLVQPVKEYNVPVTRVVVDVKDSFDVILSVDYESDDVGYENPLTIYCKIVRMVDEDDFHHPVLGPKLQRIRSVGEGKCMTMAYYLNRMLFSHNMCGLAFSY